MIALDSCQVHYQYLLITYLKDFIVTSAQILNLVLTDFMSFKDEQRSCTHLIFRCFECKNNYKKDFYNELIKRFANIYEFCNKDINKFILLLRKGVYPYEYVDSWERFDETSLPDNKTFYSSLNMEDITDADHCHANKVFKEFKLKNPGDYRDLFVQSDTLWLADVFDNFRNKCIEVYEPYPALFYLHHGWHGKHILTKQKQD